MLTYKKYEESIYNWFNKKNEQDPDFTFSFRRVASKGAKSDYFIGTEKSKYFGLTLWTIPVAYPGSSGDLITLKFKLKSTGLKAQIEIDHTLSPKDGQNQFALNLAHLIKDKVKRTDILITRETDATNKYFGFYVSNSVDTYEDIDKMLIDFDLLLNQFIPIVNEAIAETKKQNTDFEAHRITKDEFKEMEKSMIERREKNINSEESQTNIDELKTYLDLLKRIVEKFDLKKGDPRIVFSTTRNRYNFIVGQRYAFVLDKNNVKGYFGILTNELISENYEQFEGGKIPAYLNFIDEHSLTHDIIYKLESAIKLELESSRKSSFLKYNDKEFEQMIYSDNDSMMAINKNLAFSLNQILYGPPGTGKTYSTIDRVVQICSPNQYEKNNHKSNKVIYDQLVEDGNVFFTTFHQSFGYEDFIEGIKPVLSTQGNDAISYAVEDGIFKSISEQCLDEIREIKTQWDENIQDVMSFKEKYDEFVKRIQKGLIVVKTRNELEANVTRVSASGNMRLKTGKDTNDYIISSGRLKKLVEELPNPKSIKNIHDKVRSIIGGSHTTLYYAALEAFVEFEKELNNEIKEVGKEVKLKNITLSDFEINELPKYVLVIDEINRGNVSAIFGELITLLEEDKRFGRENQLFAKLPYSKLDFTVPPNLYIIGTMNTADRSVEALDTALRRRFSFHEMMPNPELLVDKGHNETGEVEGINLKQLLRTINERIEVLVDRDHTIGHSYFLHVQSQEDLKNIFKDKVIPLLQEYFFGDYSKMEMVIGSYFFKKELPQVTFAVTSENYYEERKRYVFKDFDSSEFDIITALKELLGIKEQVAVES